MLWISSTTLSFPLWEWSWRVCIVEVWLSTWIKTSNQRTYTKRSYSTFLSILLLSFSNKFRNVLYRRTIIVIKAIALALDTRLVSKNTAICSEPWIGHMYMIIKLNYFFNSPSFLKFCHSFFLVYWWSTSTARITEDSVTSPTAHSPFLTA